MYGDAKRDAVQDLVLSLHTITLRSGKFMRHLIRHNGRKYQWTKRKRKRKTEKDIHRRDD